MAIQRPLAPLFGLAYRCQMRIASGAPTIVPFMSTENRPHGGKLDKLRNNTKLPVPDRDRVEALWVAYGGWLASMDALDTRGEQRVEDLVRLLNGYKRRLDELVWDSEDDFLYRQDGQLKLRGSVVEE